MNILFVWTGVASYVADCWRALRRAPGVALRVVIDTDVATVRQNAFRADDVLRDLDCALVTRLGDAANLAGFRPDVIFAVGWHSAVVRAAVTAPEFAGVPKVCCFDMPWRWKLRCLAAPFVLGRFLRHYDAAFVPGAACARYAKWLGFREIRTGLFSVETERFCGLPTAGAPSLREPTARAPSLREPTAREFVYLGRDTPEKRIGDIRAAHALYRAHGGACGLRLCGKGLENGFVAPEDVPGLLRGAAAVVLASAFDPWPLVLLEAMASGCPVIASDRCMNRPELGKNWRVFPCGDVRALAEALADVEASAGTPRAAAARAENVALARQYDCDRWVARVLALAADLSGKGRQTC